MFKSCVNNTALTSRQADEIFSGKIYAVNNFNGDSSWLSTLRALLYDRMDDEFVLSMGFNSLLSSDISEIVRCVANRQGVPNSLKVYNVDGITDADAKTKLNPKDLEGKLDGYVYISRVTSLFVKNFTVWVFSNEELKSTIVVGFNLNYARLHYLQCATTGMMPWYFDELSEKDKKILYSLKGDTSEQYCALMQEIADQMGLREMLLREKLSGFENAYSEMMLETLRNNIRQLYEDIANYEHSIASSLKEIEENEFRYDGIQKKMNDNSGNEILEYFLANNCLDLKETNSTVMRYVVRGYLTEWDPDMADKFIANDNSYFYRSFRNRPGKEDWEKLLRAIFIDEELKLKFMCAYELNVREYRVRGLAGFCYEGYSNYMPNPHIDQYSCIGNFEPLFRECMREHDYISAIEYSIVSSRSLNLSDMTVMECFINTLLGNRHPNTANAEKCIELPDGTMTNVKGAIAYLNGKEG